MKELIVTIAVIVSIGLSYVSVEAFRTAAYWLCVENGAWEHDGFLVMGLATSIIAGLSAGWLAYGLKQHHASQILVPAPFALLALSGAAFVVAIQLDVWAPATTCRF